MRNDIFGIASSSAESLNSYSVLVLACGNVLGTQKPGGKRPGGGNIRRNVQGRDVQGGCRLSVSSTSFVIFRYLAAFI